MDIIKSRELDGNRAYGFYLSVIYFIDVSMISYFALVSKFVDTTSSFNTLAGLVPPFKRA